MKIILTSETNGQAYYYCHLCQREIESRLEILNQRDYGDELVDIMIVAIIESEPIWTDRKLFKRKTKQADIRLHIPYRPFILAKPEKKFEMVANNTIQAIQTLQHKVSKNFNYNGLMHDLGELLPENTILENRTGLG